VVEESRLMMHMDTGSSAPDGRFRFDLPFMEALLQIGAADEQAGIGGLRPHLDAASTEKSDVVSPTRLTTAEGRVEVLVRHGQSNREIATALCVSVRTVESHVSAILRKTGSASRFKLIARI
jgi:DNA-binding NarL/FixJ family response regulator